MAAAVFVVVSGTAVGFVVVVGRRTRCRMILVVVVVVAGGGLTGSGSVGWLRA